MPQHLWEGQENQTKTYRWTPKETGNQNEQLNKLSKKKTYILH